jgi:hypothetical protein
MCSNPNQTSGSHDRGVVQRAPGAGELLAIAIGSLRRMPENILPTNLQCYSTRVPSPS